MLFKEELSSNFFSAFAKFVDHYRLCYNEKLFFLHAVHRRRKGIFIWPMATDPV